MPAFRIPPQATRLSLLARIARIFKPGELVHDTDTRRLFVGDGTTTGGVPARGGDAELRAIPQDRTYEGVVRVTSTIAAALASITTNAYNRRYLVVIPDGTYAESIDLTAKPWIDLVGQSRTGTIISGTGTADTILAGGTNALIANMTVRCTPSSTPFYGIHLDASTATGLLTSTMTVVGCTVESLGANAKSAIGIGLRMSQRAYLVDSTFNRAQQAGIYAHNAAASSSPCELYCLDCVTSAPTAGQSGLLYQNMGSTQPDWLVVRGGSYSGASASIKVENSGAGAGECNVAIDPMTSAPTVSLVTASKRFDARSLLVPRLPSAQANFGDYGGRYVSAPLGAAVEVDGKIKSLRADARVYFADSAADIAYLHAVGFIPLVEGFKYYLNTTTYFDIASGTNTVRVISNSFVVAQFESTGQTRLFGPLRHGAIVSAFRAVNTGSLAGSNWGSVAAQSSASYTVTFASSTVGDPVTVGASPAPAAGTTWTAQVATAGNVTITFNNFTAGAVTPSATTFKLTIVQV